MTRNPGPLQELEAQFRRQIGPFWKGTVGDQHHFNGYHLGGHEVPPHDYSVTHPRDIEGIRLYGGNWASAVDVGMGWAASRIWLSWLVAQARAGRTSDLAEIIGSFDGHQDFRFVADDGFQHAETWLRDHVAHTHISFFRDSIFRGHAYLFDRWNAAGRVATVDVPSKSPTPAPIPIFTPPSPAPTVGVDKTGEPSSTSLRGALLAATFAGVAWIVRRRMEVAREDS